MPTPTPDRPDLPAVLLDMDGTLVDTEPSWMAAETALAHTHGATWSPEQALRLVGSALPDAAEAWRRGTGVDLPPEEVVAAWLERVVADVRESVPWRPGARALVEDLAAHGVPLALVTMSYAELAAELVADLPDGTFGAVVTGDAVTHGKPHPEPYLRAAALLGLDAGDCVAVEDSETGTRAAVAAGCLTVVVPSHVAVAPGPRRVVVPTLEQVDTAWLARTLAAHGPAGAGTPPGASARRS